MWLNVCNDSDGEETVQMWHSKKRTADDEGTPAVHVWHSKQQTTSLRPCGCARLSQWAQPDFSGQSGQRMMGLDSMHLCLCLFDSPLAR